MSNNVFRLRKRPPLLPEGDVPLALTIPPDLARSIRFTAGMAGKEPEKFVLDWLKSGFPEIAA